MKKRLLSPGRIGPAIVIASIALSSPGQAASPSADKATRQIELDQTEKLIESGAEDRAKLAAEIEALRSDRARLNQRLIDLADHIKTTESRISAIEIRLQHLASSESEVRKSLETRSAAVGDALVALQRIGRIPSSLLLGNPGDLLGTVRGSILLSAVIPELKTETDALAGDLAAMDRIRQSAAIERESLVSDVASLVRDKQDIALLVEARQRELAGAETRASDQTAKATALAAKSQTLKDLIGRVEGEVESVSKAARDARDAAQKNEDAAKQVVDPSDRDARSRYAALAFKDPNRIAPKVAFSELKGLLPLPVSGALARGFNAKDPIGGISRGITISTRPGGLVQAPCDGWVSFAGPFRTYGQLLILNAGGGYYILLAGMERISVGLGQFVLAGEPVATMAEPAKDSSSKPESDKAQPALYIEFRKDGTPIDPTPWWTSVSNEKVPG